jgi:hypothetical protein
LLLLHAVKCALEKGQKSWAMKKDKVKSSQKLIREAWNFGNVPHDEIEPCQLYEYSRESPAIIREVTATLNRQHYAESEAARKKRADWFRSNPEPRDERQHEIWRAKSVNEIGDTIIRTKLDYDIHFLIDLAENRIFPERYWLEIEPDRRRKISSSFGPDRMRWGHDPASMETRPLLIETLESFVDFRRQWPVLFMDTEHPNYSGPQVFDVCWARSDRKLTRDFAEWLKDNRPKEQPAFQVTAHGGSRRTTPRDLLKALAALRLVRAYKGDINDARFRTLETLDKFLYKDQAAWIKATDKAKQQIEIFERKMLRV